MDSPTAINVVKCAMLFVLLMMIASQPAHAQTEAVLYNFCAAGFPCLDGSGPAAGLIMDKNGNLYGTTAYGGANGVGTVFELSADGTETVLHSFSENGLDGYSPVAGLVMDKKGNLYGTTFNGGTGGYNSGTVFEVSQSGTETVLYNFCSQPNCTDGLYPSGGLVIDASGNLYGMTIRGGANDGGTVFKLAASGAEKVLYSFCSRPSCADGRSPQGGLIRKNGYFYGTTSAGGDSGQGTVFKVNPRGVATVVHSFANNGTDGYDPTTGVIMDKVGNLYGTTEYSHNGTAGTVFKLDVNGTETILYTFCPKQGNCPDGDQPSGLVLGKNGNLFGTTFYGGAKLFGTVFEVSPNGTETVLHSFTQNGDGGYPEAGLVMDKHGNLYGTTYNGGTHSDGVVFKVSP